MKKLTTFLVGGLSLCFLLTGCGKQELAEGVKLAEAAFNPQSSIRTRVQQELANNKSYANIDYLANYSLGADAGTLVELIKNQFEEIVPHVSTSITSLEFVPLKTDLVLSPGSQNHYYLINNQILVNFVVPKNNSVAWNETVSNIQFYYNVFDPSAAQLMDLISKAIIQEIESPTTALLVKEKEELKPVKNYNFVGGIYETSGKLINLNSDAIEFILKALNLKDQDYLYCFDFQRTAS